MILSALQEALHSAISVTKVYDTLPLEPALPYILLKTRHNHYWSNLVTEAMRIDVTSEYHSPIREVSILLAKVKQIKDVLTNENLVRTHPEIIYLHFINYDIKQYKTELIAAINFEMLVKT